MTRQRADRLLVERGLFESRAQAQAAIAAGLVTADGVTVRKASEPLSAVASIEASPAHPYVSRGGVKLCAALDGFGFDVNGHACLDVGASTGGFTEVLIEHGAKRVYAIDVGTAQLHSRLRGRREIVSLEQTDIRALDPSRLDQLADFATIDVSFISLKLVLPAVEKLLAPRARLVALIKPQFEANKSAIKKGVVRDDAVHRSVCENIADFVSARGWRVRGCIPSPILGGDGNAEFFIGAERG